MNEQQLREALRAPAADDPDARERSWRIVRAAAREREARPPRRPWGAAASASLLVVAAVVGVATASAPESGVGKLVRSVLAVGDTHPRPGLRELPGGGRLLVQAGRSAWVVAGDGGKRRLGGYAGATWSPRGKFVVAWREGTLTAVDPQGHVRWSIAGPARTAAARWSPADGYRVAYLAGSTLRVVYGDGARDHPVGSARPGVAPAWRPDTGHVLAYVDARGRVNVVSDKGPRLWRSAPVPGAVSVSWSPGGDRLLALTRHRLVFFDRAGRRVGSREVPAGFAAQSAVWSPHGHDLVVVRRAPVTGRSELVLVRAADPGPPDQVLFAGPGRFRTPAWSPTGRLLLLPWPDADQWLFLDLHGRGRPTAVGNIARQFAPGASRPTFPRTVSWCCSPVTPGVARSGPAAGAPAPVTAPVLERALRTNPNNKATAAACHRATAADRRQAKKTFGAAPRLFVCEIGLRRDRSEIFDVQLLDSGCFVAERRRRGQADYGCVPGR